MLQEVKQELLEALRIHDEYFLQVNGEAEYDHGWKLSIQGRTLEDSAYLFDKLMGLLISTKASYKFATQKLIDFGGEQSTKLLTIYIPNNVGPESFAELVRLNIEGYVGALGINEKKSYKKYAEGIFFRNDRNEMGEYIPA